MSASSRPKNPDIGRCVSTALAPGLVPGPGLEPEPGLVSLVVSEVVAVAIASPLLLLLVVTTIASPSSPCREGSLGGGTTDNALPVVTYATSTSTCFSSFFSPFPPPSRALLLVLVVVALRPPSVFFSSAMDFRSPIVSTVFQATRCPGGREKSQSFPMDKRPSWSMSAGGGAVEGGADVEEEEDNDEEVVVDAASTPLPVPPSPSSSDAMVLLACIVAVAYSDVEARPDERTSTGLPPHPPAPLCFLCRCWGGWRLVRPLFADFAVSRQVRNSAAREASSCSWTV